MKAQTKALVASLVVIALALSAVSGITYSWFSDTEKSDIDVSTAKVDYSASFTGKVTQGLATIEKATTTTDGYSESFDVSNIAAKTNISITADITNSSTVKTVYQVILTPTYTKPATGAGFTEYDFENIFVKAAGDTINLWSQKPSETTDDSSNITFKDIVIQDWTVVSVGTSPGEITAEISTPTTYGGDPDNPYTDGGWNAKAEREGLSFTLEVVAVQGDYPYQTMNMTNDDKTATATLPSNKVVSATKIAATSGSGSVTNVIVDFSNVSRYDEGESTTETQVTNQTLTVSIDSITATETTKNVSLTLALSGGTDNTTKNFDEPVVITMTVPMELSDPKIVYNGEEDGTVLSSTVDGETTTIVFSVDHFSTYNIVDANVVMTAAALQTSLNAGGYVKLGADISSASTITVSSKATLDLNGYGITMTGTNNSAITVSGNNANLTIKGQGHVDGGSGGDNRAVSAQNGGTVTIESGNYSVGDDKDGGGNSVIYSVDGVIMIKGGYFHTDYSWSNFYYVLNQNNGNPGTITVYGGSFENYDPSRGDDNLKKNFVADGYECTSVVKDNKTIYTVTLKTATEEAD